MYLGLTLKFCLRLEYWKMEMENLKKIIIAKNTVFSVIYFIYGFEPQSIFFVCKNVKTYNLKKTAQEH